MSASANCARVVAFVRGSYVPQAAVSRCNMRAQKPELFDHLVCKSRSRDGGTVEAECLGRS